MTDSSVVLPDPLGPTMNVSSPNRALKSVARSASMRVSPLPKNFLIPRVSTAFMTSSLRPKDGRRLELNHAPDAQPACEEDDEDDARSGNGPALPQPDEAAR